MARIKAKIKTKAASALKKKPVKAKALSSEKAEPKKKSMVLYGLVLFGIILVALSMRLYQPDWYNDKQFHPDERWIVSNAVPSLSYPAKPIGLQYGSLPLYILATYKDALNVIQKAGLRINNYNAAYIGGARAISGIFDTGTIVLIFLIAALLFSPQVALLASTLLAFTALHIHASHFYTVDTFVTFFVTLTVYFSARIYKKGGTLDYVLAGIAYAAAIASKTAGAPAILVPITAHFLSFFEISGGKREAAEKKFNAWINLAWFALASAVAFFAFMPYAILDFNTFFRDQNYQKDILVTGKGDVPYNRQYIDTPKYLFYIKNLALYTMGLPLAIVSFAALLFYSVKTGLGLLKAKISDKSALLVLVWMLPYFAIVGGSFAKFNRYMLPFTPFLALLGAKFIYDLYDMIKSRFVVSAIKWITVAGAIFYGVAFMNVYVQGHTWIKASEWIYSNVPQFTQQPEGNKPGIRTKVLNEMWGDDLPTFARNGNPGMYENLKWNVQEPDTDRKLDELSYNLAITDYVMLADKRAYGTYQRIPQRYPINYFYFKTMLNTPEKFGYKLVYEKSVYPELFGIKIKDDHADESFQLYDHPHVYIFKNETKMKQEELRALLASGSEEVRQKTGNKSFAGIFTSFKANPNMGKKLAAFSTLISPSVSVFMWYALIQLLALMAIPLHFTLFKNLADKGYGLSKVTGLFIFSFINWMLVSLKIIPFTQTALYVLIFALAAGVFVMMKKNNSAIRQFYAENKRHVLINETVFLGAYMAFVIVKLFCPDIHNVPGHGYNGGGEPMGMAYLSAIFNSVTFPPYDPWMSGYTLNYYYWGQLMLATVSKVLGILPRVSYNLSLSILFALSAIAAFSLVYNLTKKYSYAFLAAFLLAMAGNFHTLQFIFDKIMSYQNFFNSIASVNVFQFIWDPTRIYPSPAITELPFFSYLYGDLHAHNIVIPVTVVLIALLFNIFSGQSRDLALAPENTLKEKILTGAFVSVLLGSMMSINTWNYPPMAVLIALVIFTMTFFLIKEKLSDKKIKVKDKPAAISGAVIRNASVLLVIAVLSYIAFLPFHVNFKSPYSSGPNFIGKQERATMFQMYKYFSVFFFVISAYALRVYWMGAEKILTQTAALKLKMKKFNFDKLSDHAGKVFEKIMDDGSMAFKFIGFASVLAISVAASIIIQPTFGPLIMMLVPLSYMAIKSENNAERFSLILASLSVAMILGTEILFIADGRMNTVFKFYMVVWTMLAVSVPYLLYACVQSMPKLFAPDKKSGLLIAGAAALLLVITFAVYAYDNKRGTQFMPAFMIIVTALSPALILAFKNRASKIITAGVFFFLIIPAALYPVWGSAIKMGICSLNAPKGARIDGLKFMEKIERRPGAERDYDKHDHAAIEWLRKNVTKIEPVLEAPGEQMYSGISRISIYSGLPTMIGWAYQVSQQSGRPDVNTRVSDANYIYTTPDAQAALAKLKQYGVRYVWIGSIERAMYPMNLAKFDTICTPVMSSGESVLYKVND